MKTAGKWLSFTVLAGLLAALLAFAGCSGGGDESTPNTPNKPSSPNTPGVSEEDENTVDVIAVTDIYLKPSTSLVVDGTETLVPTITPSNATNKNVTWNSSNANIATVSTNGTVTGVSVGNVTITVTTVDGGKTASCEVTVSPVEIPLTGVSLNKGSTSLVFGGTETLTATITPLNATNQNLTWESSNPEVATVENGLITAVSTGTATITVTTVDGNKTAYCEVTVVKANGEKVSTPTLNSITYNSITIHPVTASNGQIVEYAISTSSSAPSSESAWQSSITFTGLTAGTTYYIYARTTENSNYKTGSASDYLSVTTPQTGTANIEYYWVDQHGSLVTTSGGVVTVCIGSTLIITAQGTGYTVKQWHLNGVDTEQKGNTYSFSSRIVGKHTVGLFLEKGGKLYNTNIIITTFENKVVFSEDFEGTSHSFTIVNGTQTNKWYVGTATKYAGTKSAYISNNNGTSNAYTITSSSQVYMYRDVTFPFSRESYNLSFYWKCQGETGSDYLRMYLVSTSVTPTAGSTLSGYTPLGTFNLGGATSWKLANITIPQSNSGTTMRLVFFWNNDSNNYGVESTSPPIAVDNIELKVN